MNNKLDTQSANRRRRSEDARNAALYFAFGGLSPMEAVDHIRSKFDLDDFSYRDVINMVKTRIDYIDLAWKNASTWLLEKFPWYVEESGVMHGFVRMCIETSDAKIYATAYREQDERGCRHRAGDCYLTGLVGVKGQQIFHDKYDELIERVAGQLDPPERWGERESA